MYGAATIVTAPLIVIIMHRENFTAYEVMPEDLAIYLSHNGPHFNKQAFKFAVSNMFKDSEDDEKEEEVVPYTKKQIDEIMVLKLKIIIFMTQHMLLQCVKLIILVKVYLMKSILQNMLKTH